VALKFDVHVPNIMFSTGTVIVSLPELIYLYLTYEILLLNMQLSCSDVYVPSGGTGCGGSNKGIINYKYIRKIHF